MSKENKNLIVGLDIGTSKVVAIVAELAPDGRLEVIGMGSHEPKGLKKEVGVCLVDIGGGTTDVAIFREGAIRHTAVIPIAGDQITNDIAMALRTPTQE